MIIELHDPILLSVKVILSKVQSSMSFFLACALAPNRWPEAIDRWTAPRDKLNISWPFYNRHTFEALLRNFNGASENPEAKKMSDVDEWSGFWRGIVRRLADGFAFAPTGSCSLVTDIIVTISKIVVHHTTSNESSTRLELQLLVLRYNEKLNGRSRERQIYQCLLK